jgi:hypothetical protein
LPLGICSYVGGLNPRSTIPYPDSYTVHTLTNSTNFTITSAEAGIAFTGSAGTVVATELTYVDNNGLNAKSTVPYADGMSYIYFFWKYNFYKWRKN